jgi:hypothetical protein
MSEEAYLKAVQNLLQRFDMDWKRPAGFDAHGRFFTSVAHKKFGIYIIDPAHLSEQERVTAIEELQAKLA